jgi:hypothetical protein
LASRSNSSPDNIVHRAWVVSALHAEETDRTRRSAAKESGRASAAIAECNKHIPQLAVLAKRYSDRNPDLADLCLIRMSELYPHHKVITTDREDFSVYRRNKREFIPLVCRPGRPIEASRRFAASWICLRTRRSP